jgi:hypothetical protein
LAFRWKKAISYHLSSIPEDREPWKVIIPAKFLDYSTERGPDVVEGLEAGRQLKFN